MALNPYEYSKIAESGIIRLIRLQPSKDLEAELSCSLINASLKDLENEVVDHYIALSYVWGDASQKGSILIDGKSLEITSSLDLALRHLRDEHRVVRIWADGICINQNDVHDRNTQVAVMGSIYTNARHTIIFLGPSNPKLDSALRNISAFHTLDESSQVRLVDEMLAYPWFTRVWILQELVLSPDPWIQVGRIHFTWNSLRKQTDMGEYSGPDGPRKRLNEMCQIRDNYQAKKHVGVTDRTDITMLDILKARRGMGVADPRDMVYAHLGLVEFKARLYISIDYSKSKARVFEDVARYFHNDSNDLSILALVENIDLEFRDGLPSWVPDWTVSMADDFSISRARKPLKRPKYSPLKPALCKLPGIIAFEGVCYEIDMYIFPQAVTSSFKDVDYCNKEKLLEWMFKPEIRETIQVLSRYYVDFHKGSILFDLFVEPDVPNQSALLKYLEFISDLFKKEPTVETRKKMETGPGLNIAWNLYFFLRDIVDFDTRSRGRELEQKERIAFIRQGKDIKIRRLPDSVRVGDIMVKHSCHDELFIFRRHELSNDLEYTAKIRNAMSMGEPDEPIDNLPSQVECCRFVAYIEDEPNSFESQLLTAKGNKKVLFALH